jgi:hypothetical protein
MVGRGELRRAAQAVNERLIIRLLEGEMDVKAFVDYLSGLQMLAEASTLTFWALRELSDPTASDHALEGAAPVVGDIAARLYEEGLAGTGFDLLERCLENEQWLDAEDAVGIVGRVRRWAVGPRLVAVKRSSRRFAASLSTGMPKRSFTLSSSSWRRKATELAWRT